MAKKTAIDWLVEQTRTPGWNSLKRGDILEIAKEKEKQQIIEAHEVGRIKGVEGVNSDREQYYTETYKND